MNRQLLNAIEAEWSAGNGCMLATVVSRSGSAPRGAGTGMVVSSAGEQTGTVGGGFLEYRVKQDSLALLQQNESGIRDYVIHADEKDAYSGGVTILFRAFDCETARPLVQAMLAALDREADAYLVCPIAGTQSGDSVVLSAAALTETCGVENLPDQPTLSGENPGWFIEPLLETPRVLLFGGGHVAQCMARQLDLLEYRVWVLEDREAFAQESLFPAAERVICCDYDRVETSLQITKRDHGIVMSRGHETDYQILRWLLRSKADYIGCIGSKRKISLTKERLLADGVTESQIARLHAPVGLSIGAQTPAEIAVSIAAELISYLSYKA